MTDRDQIIAWAREAGFDICGASGQRPNEVTVEDFICTEEIERLIRIVAAHEREQCAIAAEKQARWIGYNAHAEAIAAAIRGRAEKCPT